MFAENFLLTYQEAENLNASQIGTKAYNVIRCYKHGFLIPDGIILSNDAYKTFLKADSLDNLFLEIEQFFTGNKNLIVRSSALEEDKDSASFAGQYLTAICSCTVSEIKKACEACWLSFSSQNVKAYYKNVHTGGEPINEGMGLLIQKVVNSDTSGVCFTKDPINNSNRVIIINAIHGLGEALMEEEVIADQYNYDLDDKKIRTIIEKRQTSWRSPENYQILSPIPTHLINKNVLKTIQIKKIIQLAKEIVDFYKSPQDIEWTFENNKLYLLQTRPITTGKKDKGFILWTRDNVADVIPDAVTPLTWSVVKKATNGAFKKAIRDLGFPFEPTELFKLFDGRVYFNQTAYQKLLNPCIKRNPLFFIKVGVKYLILLLSSKKTRMLRYQILPLLSLN